MSEATESAAPTDPPSLGYEEARDQLIEVVRQLESGGLTLEQSIALWERGEKLVEICQTWLDGARARLEAASATSDE
jgi:exodeoxyribonuclease VII small subunit